MEAGTDLAHYKVALIILSTASVVIPVFHRLRINPVLGFILVGMAVGPFGIGSLAASYPWLAAITIDSPHTLQPVAELGVALLLFMIGLELSFERLLLMRRLVFGLGMLQVVVTTAVLTGAGLLFGLELTSASLIGIALAMSSTAVVLQVLAQEKKLNTPTGRGSFAILLFQDLAVVPALFAVNALASGPGISGIAGFGLAVSHALLAVGGIVVLGRLILRPVFRSVARTQSTELFVAACLFVVISSGIATALAGLSMSIGALIGGSLLAGTEYRRQVELTIDPFKGLLVGVFLISIGMGIDIAMLVGHSLIVLGAASGLIVAKTLILVPLARAFGLSWQSGLQCGLLLGPGGEFGFVILSLAASKALLEKADAEFILAITALTMALIPVLGSLGQLLTPRLPRHPSVDPDLLLPSSHETAPRVIVAGFGRVGQMVGMMLEVHKIPYVAVDMDPDLVARQRTHSKSIYYGDMMQTDLLRHLPLETAHALVITLDDPNVTGRLVACARAERPELLIVTRARDARHAAKLYQAGASDAVPETVEASLQLAEAVLVNIGIPMGPVIASIHEKRSELQGDIKAMAPGVEVRLRGRRRLRDAVQEQA